MRRAAALALALALAACGGPGGGRFGDGPRLRPVANPGEVVATELSFARAAREDGQWTAFLEYAADGAVMFAPGPVEAKQWLKGRANPAGAVEWEPYQVWSSCDGSLAVTKGGWTRPDGSVGWFATVWQRQEDGSYKWVLDVGDTLDEALDEPELVQADVAECGEPEAADGVVFRNKPIADRGGGASGDYTLSFDWAAYTDSSVDLSVSIMKSNMATEVLSARVEAPAE